MDIHVCQGKIIKKCLTPNVSPFTNNTHLILLPKPILGLFFHFPLFLSSRFHKIHTEATTSAKDTVCNLSFRIWIFPWKVSHSLLPSMLVLSQCIILQPKWLVARYRFSLGYMVSIKHWMVTLQVKGLWRRLRPLWKLSKGVEPILVHMRCFEWEVFPTDGSLCIWTLLPQSTVLFGKATEQRFLTWESRPWCIYTMEYFSY